MLNVVKLSVMAPSISSTYGLMSRAAFGQMSSMLLMATTFGGKIAKKCYSALQLYP
jgi:hypothetical protein